MLEDVKELMHRLPFGPFRIVTASGEKYEVVNPDNIALMDGRIFYSFPKGDHWVFIRTQNITALESVQKAA